MALRALGNWWEMNNNPVLIQGGMGVGVSNWQLAQAVACQGQLGVVSGTFLDLVFARRLQDGDIDGHMRRAIDKFPFPQLARRVFEQYYLDGGRRPDQPYRQVPLFSTRPAVSLSELTVLANFAEVYLAKEGHDGLVGINYLEKIQLPTLPSLLGAMLGGVDYVLMGAGIPRAIPGVLDQLSQCQKVRLRLDLELTNEQPEGADEVYLDPKEFCPDVQQLKRPKFLAIVSSHVLAANLARKASGHVDGFVVENHRAGGHNAPPRGSLVLAENGEPVYGTRDEANLEEMCKIGRPFWLAGAYGNFDKLAEALAAGAAGVQVGTPFAYCQESGIAAKIKTAVRDKILNASANVFTDPLASSSGYPFKIVQLEGSLSETEVFRQRKRICDLGYLRAPYREQDGSVGFRCPAEPESDYVRKGGKIEDTLNRKCLCNGLMATIGLGQVRKQGYEEPPLITAGDCIPDLKHFMDQGVYTAKDVVDRILGSNASSRSCHSRDSHALAPCSADRQRS